MSHSGLSEVVTFDYQNPVFKYPTEHHRELSTSSGRQGAVISNCLPGPFTAWVVVRVSVS